MPKFLLGNVVVKTFEVWAESKEQAEGFVLDWQTGESEQPEGGIKATKYGMSWDEDNRLDPTENRNKVLAEFLHLMESLPGRPEAKKGSLIIHPFEKSELPPAPKGMIWVPRPDRHGEFMLEKKL